MKYTENDITVGTKMICKDNQDIPWWKNGKIYEVKKSTVMVEDVCIIDEQGSERYLEGILARLNNENNSVKFEIVEEEKEMTKYVEVTHLMDFTPDEGVIEIGKKYEVVEDCEDGVYIYANKSHQKYFVYNNQIKRVEEKEMKYTEKDLYEGMELLCINNGGLSFWETGEIYKVTKSKLTGKLIIEGDDTVGRTIRVTKEILEYLNGKKGVRLSTIDDQKGEEKEMKKYAKITKYAGLIDTDKENGLEIGKEYEIVKFSSVSEDCWVYLNDKRPEYFISETQYELVEKEEPTLKANVNVDVKEAIQAKIEQLRTDAEIISNKRNRMEWQMFNLNSKANKLEEVLETIKEFE